MYFPGNPHQYPMSLPSCSANNPEQIATNGLFPFPVVYTPTLQMRVPSVVTSADSTPSNSFADRRIGTFVSPIGFFNPGWVLQSPTISAEKPLRHSITRILGEDGLTSSLSLIGLSSESEGDTTPKGSRKRKSRSEKPKAKREKKRKELKSPESVEIARNPKPRGSPIECVQQSPDVLLTDTSARPQRKILLGKHKNVKITLKLMSPK